MDIYRGHRSVPKLLQLPPRFYFTQRYLSAYDPDLRLRRSAEAPEFYVLERRKRRAPVRFKGLLDLTDVHIQARDGYDHVALVHPNWLPKPHLMVRELVSQGWDLWQARDGQRSGATVAADQMDEDEAWAKEMRRRRRKQMFRAVALEGYATLDRMGNPDGTERTRINNAGIPGAASVAA